MEYEGREMLGSIPNLVVLVAGEAEGGSELNAFDNALLGAGIGDLNLVYVSSIVPPKAKVTYDVPHIKKGTLVPVVMAKVVSDKEGERISAAIGVGLGKDFGIIMEHTSRGSDEDIKKVVERKLEEAFRVRNMEMKRFHSICGVHTVEKLGCAIAAAILWWR